MKILLDSHVFVWFVLGSARCTTTAHELIARADVTAYVSAATAWELATKVRIGKLPEAAGIVRDFARLLSDLDFDPMPVTIEHGRVAGLYVSPHKDPFDRMLAAQAQVELVPLVTADPRFSSFGTTTIW